jgi:hypothetical protein
MPANEGALLARVRNPVSEPVISRQPLEIAVVTRPRPPFVARIALSSADTPNLRAKRHR